MLSEVSQRSKELVTDVPYMLAGGRRHDCIDTSALVGGMRPRLRTVGNMLRWHDMSHEDRDSELSRGKAVSSDRYAA